MLPIKLLGNLLLVNLLTIQMLFMYMFYIIYGGDSATNFILTGMLMDDIITILPNILSTKRRLRMSLKIPTGNEKP
jgi:hypothetical protein